MRVPFLFMLMISFAFLVAYQRASRERIRDFGAYLLLLSNFEIESLLLQREQLQEQISLRFSGLRRGIIIWETTLDLGFKLIRYCVVCGICSLLGR